MHTGVDYKAVAVAGGLQRYLLTVGGVELLILSVSSDELLRSTSRKKTFRK